MQKRHMKQRRKEKGEEKGKEKGRLERGDIQHRQIPKDLSVKTPGVPKKIQPFFQTHDSAPVFNTWLQIEFAQKR